MKDEQPEYLSCIVVLISAVILAVLILFTMLFLEVE